MRVLVCGSPLYGDRLKMTMVLDELDYDRNFTALIHGAAFGPDTLADGWAKRRGIPTEAYPVDRKHFGSAGELFRNRQMLVAGLPDLVVGFWTSLANVADSKDMINQAKWAGVEIIDVD